MESTTNPVPPNPVPPNPVPSDNTTLVAIIQGYRDSGFGSDFSSLDGARIRCESCGAESDAAMFAIESLRRLEGASDPDDMLAVVATQCPACSAKGTLILGYGPMASGEDTDIAAAMKDGREQSPLPPNASPADAKPVAS